ncbi:hypothetical protein T552_01278 [Pneumocystis carinii B80]|uniref:protein-histidine N-methyltransferase n=1 Tax=Pneumocystis carinii (strain B80) TaxID=1408658 RepID=A0A0W4ZLS8_PNEC8|nr:hypothetical protein T552_01278 [Pneumocystis carinii B80]KTW29323.1 hypothetical protein T552_01278 [Pneumocystis carinii B80]
MYDGDISINPSFLPPKRHTLEELIEFLPENISFDVVQVDFEGNFSYKALLPKRTVWDIELQLMAYDYDTSQSELLFLNGSSDIIPNVYEGGYKTWECSYDLMEYVRKTSLKYSKVLELGCGSSLPSVVLFIETLVNSREQAVNFTLQDYNVSVLKFLTIPNLFLAWAIVKNQEIASMKEMNITNTIKEEFLCDLRERKITINCISGGWCDKMNDLILDKHDLILASETIYSKQNLDTFINILAYNIGNYKEGKALIAAKKTYFGLDVSIEDFVQKLKDFNLNYSYVYESINTGIVRVILNIECLL